MVEEDDDVGLSWYRARWYDPETGRFVSEDPIGFSAGDTNLNRYVSNGPVNGTDPSGLEEYTISNYKKKFFDAATNKTVVDPRLAMGNPAPWQVHHIYSRQPEIADLAKEFGGINVHAPENLRLLPRQIHGTVTNLQNGWWTAMTQRMDMEGRK